MADSKTAQHSGFSTFNVRANRRVFNEFVSKQEQDREYIAELERLLIAHNIEVPDEISALRNRTTAEHAARRKKETDSSAVGVIDDSSLPTLKKALSKVVDIVQNHEMPIHFRHLNFWNMVGETTIPTVGSTLRTILMGPGEKHRVDILHDLNGRILPGKTTLVMGPPGSGKSTFLRALSGKLNIGSSHLDGTITYNGSTPDSGKYILSKVADYVDEREVHAATLTVRETLEFAWMMSTGGHHSYMLAKDEAGAEILNQDDEARAKVQNVLKVLGLYEVQNTVVGDNMLRGVSGGQKRRVTLGEMLMPPRPVKYLDAISNGLDASTTYDIVRATKLASEMFGLTIVTSLLQPAPEIFYSFDDLILFSEGQIIYHGPIDQVATYFEGLGYKCPDSVDLADYLQELPTPEGRRFIVSSPLCPKFEESLSDQTAAIDDIDSAEAFNGALEMRTFEPQVPHTVPRGTTALAAAWKSSDLFLAMEESMQQSEKVTKEADWPPFFREPYPASFWFALYHCLDRQIKVTIRDTVFLKGRLLQSIIVGSIAGSLFSDLPTSDAQSMLGILFFSSLYSALSNFSLLPLIFKQRDVFYKHSRALLFPTPAFVLSQTLVLYPLQIIEVILFSTIVYWSVGMTDDDNGGRFITFMLVIFAFCLCVGQIFRCITTFMSSEVVAQPLAGVCVVLMVLFSGYIIPKANIPPGWIWFYWINPVAYALQGLMVNEFLSSDYDYTICTDPLLCNPKRFGDVILDSRGLPKEQAWVWYGVAIMLAEYFVLIALSSVLLSYLRVEPVPPAPVFVDEATMLAADRDANECGKSRDGTSERSAGAASSIDIPFEPVSLAFQNVWYTVNLKNGEELDLLKDVSGYFEPGTLTALMGSSGAGKTTLLDVLSGRKNVGVIKGNIMVNGKPKEEHSFKRIMGYVEQFDSLSPHDTAREAVEFSAALRLPRGTSTSTIKELTNNILSMLELGPLENTLVGDARSGGMSFEQKKRVSIAVELAANPAILFLDEPTSGLDSRSAQVVIRCIKRVASSGRSIVCTIHQPSTYIFDAFDSLLLLRRGGQTVYFGELGDSACNLVSYFESAPGVAAMPSQMNPATWMLEVIGAGTGNTSGNVTDFHAYYNSSALASANTTHIGALCDACDSAASDTFNSKQDQECTFLPVFFARHNGTGQLPLSKDDFKFRYNATYLEQFKRLMYRFLLMYWRSPTYNFVRMLVSIVIALIFSSTYANQQYSDDVDTISRVAVMYITALFMGVVGMMTVQSVVFGERPAFYREKHSEIYDVKLYAIAGTLVEVPYLVASSILFVVPFFFIVGFDKDGTAEKFFWYWLFQSLYISTLVFLGTFVACAMPDRGSSSVVSGMSSTIISMFSGFAITASDIPSFWVFLYWLDPLHYCLEGLVVTQFNGDDTTITLVTGQVTTASAYVSDYFSTWDYKHRFGDMVALLIFIIVLRFSTYLALEYLRHDKR